MKQAVILAGGKGTRLQARLAGLPKPLIDVCGVPLLERQMLLVKRFGFEKVLVLVNHRADAIVEFCHTRDSWGMQLECIDDGEPRGTAGAMAQVIDRLDEEFLVIYGDTMLEVDLGRFHSAHRRIQGVHATLFLHPNDHPQDSDLVEVNDGGRVVAFHPYPRPAGRWHRNLVNAALYWMRRDAIEPWRYAGGSLDFGRDVFPDMLRRGFFLNGYVSPEYVKDCGTPERLDKVCRDVAEGRVARASLHQMQAAIFVDRDGTINREVGHLRRQDQLEVLQGVGGAIRRLNHAEFRVCVVTNQPVVARGECTFGDLRLIHDRLETELGVEGAFLDGIYVCPHHPDRGFPGEIEELKIRCRCRKPASGLIDQACRQFNVDRRRSWMIGDSTADVMAAASSGIRSILVETGNAGMDEKYPCRPDYVREDLASAVELILEIHPILMETAALLSEGIGPGQLVLIGGQSRSGKSTLASVLREQLEIRGQNCQIVCTDNWIRGASSRGPGVLGRHDIPAIDAFRRSVRHRSTDLGLRLPAYLPRTRTSLRDAQELTVDTDTVVILEGVAALLGQSIEADHAFYVEIDERERRRRVLRQYQLRGYSVADAESVYDSRVADEVPIVAGGAANARRIMMPRHKHGGPGH